MTKKIQASAILRDGGKLADNTRKLTLYCQEMQAEDELEIIRNHNKQGWFFFSPVKMEEIKVPEFTPEFKGEKSPAQRMKNVIYLLGQKENPNMDAEQYYRSKMEILIDYLKKQLD